MSFLHVISPYQGISLHNQFMQRSDDDFRLLWLYKHRKETWKNNVQYCSIIMFNNYCHLYSPRSLKEPKLKVLKLSNEQ